MMNSGNDGVVIGRRYDFTFPPRLNTKAYFLSTPSQGEAPGLRCSRKEEQGSRREDPGQRIAGEARQARRRQRGKFPPSFSVISDPDSPLSALAFASIADVMNLAKGGDAKNVKAAEKFAERLRGWLRARGGRTRVSVDA